ncbi:hypothetical protein [Campylobacter sp.]|uniref:hypothetical protein n=1 Tax=Campylobacter sp. TaxID=205 RepID=UPI0025B88D95|nr:hypothetical protein [Campylobacter sp.]
MLPLLWIGGVIASAVVGKKIYDSLNDNYDDDNYNDESEKSNEEKSYDILLDEYTKKFRSKNIEIRTISYSQAKDLLLQCFWFLHITPKPKHFPLQPIEFLKSQELDNLDKQIHSLENEIKEIEKFQNDLRTMSKEI